MTNNKNGLDEMQKAQRGNIGNQMFMIMFFALMFDCGLYGYGIRWLEYPANVMVIITVCMSIYLVRLIARNAYCPPQHNKRKSAITFIITIVLSILLGAGAAKFFAPIHAQIPGSPDDNSAVILMAVSGVGLLVAAIVAAVKKAANKDIEDN